MLHYMKPLETTETMMGGSFVKLSFVPLKEGMSLDYCRAGVFLQNSHNYLQTGKVIHFLA